MHCGVAAFVCIAESNGKNGATAKGNSKTTDFPRSAVADTPAGHITRDRRFVSQPYLVISTPCPHHVQTKYGGGGGVRNNRQNPPKSIKCTYTPTPYYNIGRQHSAQSMQHFVGENGSKNNHSDMPDNTTYSTLYIRPAKYISKHLVSSQQGGTISPATLPHSRTDIFYIGLSLRIYIYIRTINSREIFWTR